MFNDANPTKQKLFLIKTKLPSEVLVYDENETNATTPLIQLNLIQV